MKTWQPSLFGSRTHVLVCLPSCDLESTETHNDWMNVDKCFAAAVGGTPPLVKRPFSSCEDISNSSRQHDGSP